MSQRTSPFSSQPIVSFFAFASFQCATERVPRYESLWRRAPYPYRSLHTPAPANSALIPGPVALAERVFITSNDVVKRGIDGSICSAMSLKLAVLIPEAADTYSTAIWKGMSYLLYALLQR